MLSSKLHTSKAAGVAPALRLAPPRVPRSNGLACNAVAASRVLKTVEVSLGDRSYPIYIGNGILDTNTELLRKHIPGSRVLVVTNETIAPLYLEK